MWTDAGKKEPMRYGLLDGGSDGKSTVRIMTITLQSTVRRKQTEKFFIANIYAPHSGKRKKRNKYFMTHWMTHSIINQMIPTL